MPGVMSQIGSESNGINCFFANKGNWSEIFEAWTDYIEDLGRSRLGLGPSEMMEVMEDREVWRLNLELLPPQPLRKSGR